MTRIPIAKLHCFKSLAQYKCTFNSNIHFQTHFKVNFPALFSRRLFFGCVFVIISHPLNSWFELSHSCISLHDCHDVYFLSMMCVCVLCMQLLCMYIDLFLYVVFTFIEFCLKYRYFQLIIHPCSRQCTKVQIQVPSFLFGLVDKMAFWGKLEERKLKTYMLPRHPQLYVQCFPPVSSLPSSP